MSGPGSTPRAVFYGDPLTSTHLPFAITKSDDALGVVFGWASVVEKVVEGQRLAIVDHQDDIIPGHVLEKAVVKFMEDYRTSGEMHAGEANGVIVESLYLSPEKALAMDLPAEVAKQVNTGWWIGVKVTPEVMQRVKDGTYKMFSIQGDADVEEAA